VDLEAEPKIDKDNPPDLKAYADATTPAPASDKEDGPPAAAAPTAAAAAGPAAAAGAGAGSSKKAKAVGGSKAASAAPAEQSDGVKQLLATSVVDRTDELINKVRAIWWLLAAPSSSGLPGLRGAAAAAGGFQSTA